MCAVEMFPIAIPSFTGQEKLARHRQVPLERFTQEVAGTPPPKPAPCQES